MTHGTLSGYTNQGCRCEECREARRIYGQEYYYRVTRPRRPPTNRTARHGSRSMYTNQGCRCTDCRKANAIYCLARKQQDERIS